jgi:hypothetical protein
MDKSEEILRDTYPMNMFPEAINKIWDVCTNALSSGHHFPDDWKSLGVFGNLDHLYAHLGGMDSNSGQNLRPDESEDHLINICCRALMALQLRIEQEKKNANKKD